MRNKRSRQLCWATTLLAAHSLLLASSATAQEHPTTTLSGTVADPSGAVIPGAILFVTAKDSSEPPHSITTDSAGRYSVVLTPGIYEVSARITGFNSYTRSITIAARPMRFDLKLTIAAEAEQVDVSPDSDDTASGNNKSTLSLKGSALAALSPEDSTFQKEVLAMAGGAGGTGTQIYVDGFSGGSFPTKDSIREIRINQSPFSAQYEDLGFGRIEISTKPGTDKLHGSFYSVGNADTFNSRNPYAGTEPPYYALIAGGDLSGPLGKKTSLFLSERYNDLEGNSIVNAFNPDGSPLSQAVPSPQSFKDTSVRLDRQLSKNNTFVSRYEYSSAIQSNSGVGSLVLPSQGIDLSTITQTLQAGNTQQIGAKIVSETRFQYLRTRTSQTANSKAPTIIVQGSFNGGGSPAGASDDKQDRYEFQQYLSIAHDKHLIRTGVRYRLLRDSNRSSANYNGQYTFTNLAAYQAGTPSLFNLTAGQPSATILTGDVGAYAEDEWQVRKNINLTYGLRIESQTAVPDHLNPAPRLGASWGIGQTDKHPPFVVLRANAGIFYERFLPADILTSVRQDGIRQQSYFVTDPTFYPNIPTAAQLTSTPPTTYSISPHLKISTAIIGSLAIERTLGKIGSVAATYYAVRGTHEYNSFNINAPLPGTYDPSVPGSVGARPLGGTQNIYQFASEGISKAQSINVNGNLHPGKNLSIFFFYLARRQNSDTFGSGSFPSQPYNLRADFGASGLGRQATAQRLFAGTDYKLPYGFSANLFLATLSRDRFNITTGTDLNGDTQYNDRPAFATSPGPTSILYKTAHGTFDANPQPGETIIPYNYGRGPRLFFSELGLSRDFKFGPRPAAEPPPPGAPVPKGPIPRPDPRYNLSFSIDANNVLNHVNAGPPVGVLTSPYFGRSLTLNPFFTYSVAANRSVFLQTSFHF